MLKIHETGEAAVHLDAGPDDIAIVLAEGRFSLPPGSLQAVFRKFGGDLDPHAAIMEIAALEVPEGLLRHVRHKMTWDVIARDYLVLGDRCVLATTAAGALEHLGRAHRMI